MYNHCDNCGVDISDDLKYCPFCGKCVSEKPAQGKQSFPIVDQSYIYREKWFKIVSQATLLLALLLVAINLIFMTKIFWFPYAVYALFCVYMVVIYPFGGSRGHIACVPLSGLILASFMVGIDIYAHFTIGTTFGWGYALVAPIIVGATSVLAFILALCTKRYSGFLVRGLIAIELISLLYLIFKMVFFRNLSTIPVFITFALNSLALFFVFCFKRKNMKKEMDKEFHL